MLRELRLMASLRELRLNNIPNTETLSVRVWHCQTPTSGDIIFNQLPNLSAVVESLPNLVEVEV
jgi:hypothetical protein